jgi:hypothetical protein
MAIAKFEIESREPFADRCIPGEDIDWVVNNRAGRYDIAIAAGTERPN